MVMKECSAPTKVKITKKGKTL